MDRARRTMDLFAGGMTCSQAMLSVFGEECGLDMELVASLGRPLSGGMGRNGRTCGAVTAAALLLGLTSDDPEEAKARQVCFQLTQQLFQRFASLHGTTECRELLGADWSTAEGSRRIQEEGLVKNRCPAFVRDAAALLEELLRMRSEPGRQTST